MPRIGEERRGEEEERERDRRGPQTDPLVLFTVLCMDWVPVGSGTFRWRQGTMGLGQE